MLVWKEGEVGKGTFPAEELAFTRQWGLQVVAGALTAEAVSGEARR